MTIYRVHYRPRQVRLIEDVQADEVSRDRGGGLTLWGWVLIIGHPRRVVALRVRQLEVHHVENLCAQAASPPPAPAPRPPHPAPPRDEGTASP